RGREPLRAGVAVGASGVDRDGPRGAPADRLLTPQHRVGLAAVRGEDGGCGVVRAVVDQHRHVGRPAGLQPGADSRGAKAGGSGDTHGAIPTVESPVVSGQPRAMFIDCTAPPAVPLVRLSTAPTATNRPVRSSTVACTCTVFAPIVAWVCGHWPSGSRCTNGSDA